MAKTDWRGWGKRFREHAYDNGHSLESLADTLERSAASLRHWTNGHREINLSEFFKLCEAAGVDPALVLFGAAPMNEETRKRIGNAIMGVLDADPATKPGYSKMAKGLRKKAKV